MFNKKDTRRNSYMLNGKFKKQGYDWWWHNFTAINKKTGEKKPFFIEFFIINPGISPDKVVLGQENPTKKIKPSYLMVKCGSWGDNKKQLHRFFSLKEVSIQKNPIEIKAGDCYLSETRLKGNVRVKNPTPGMMCDEGNMSFDLKIDKNIAYNVGYGTSKLFCFLKAFEMYWHAQGMKSFYEGTINYCGEEYVVERETSNGYADKNWGSNFTSPWVWLSTNQIYRESTGEKLENSVFDIGGGRPKAFGIRFNRKLLGAYYIEGKEYEFNFSKFWSPSKTYFDFSEEDSKYVEWTVIQENRKYKIITKAKCEKDKMLFVNYENPLGEKQHQRLWNGGHGFGTMEIYRKKKDLELIEKLRLEDMGCEYGEFKL